MIPKISSSTIYSTLGNNSSLVPLAIKDIANSCGLTTASYLAGDKVEGKDRFIDEFGTQAIWLWGIPTYKAILDKTLFKASNLDPEVDARILKDKNIAELAKNFAPTEEIKNSIENVLAKQGKFKALTVTKFIASTALTALTYFGLTKFRHHYTENRIKKDYFKKQKAQEEYKNENIPFSSAFSNVHNSKNISFTGGIQDFMFDPVKNLMLVDATITGERLTHSRNPQDFMGYVIKEGSFWAFMYFAGPMIAKALEKHSEKVFKKSIDLDARVIESEEFKNAFKNGTLKECIEAFKLADKSDSEIYKFAVDSGNKNLVIDMAKKSDIISIMRDSGKVDTRKYINLDDLRGFSKKMEKLLSQYENSGEDLDTFFKSLRKLKRGAVIKNIGSCIGALGILAPAIMLFMRKFNNNSDYQVKKDIEAELAKIK
ncbi:hypothetical protein J6G99_03570 [bacterium]|nr:hypothetical protein [bacterium]